MNKQKTGFSLVEVLAAVTIIGIIVFLAIPNIVQIKEDGEDNLAIARAESLNMAMSSFIQARGRATATNLWTTNKAANYELLRPYLAFAESNSANYMPNGYDFSFNAISPPQKVTLTKSTNVINY